MSIILPQAQIYGFLVVSTRSFFQIEILKERLGEKIDFKLLSLLDFSIFLFLFQVLVSYKEGFFKSYLAQMEESEDFGSVLKTG